MKAFTTVELELIKENHRDIYWTVTQQEERTETNSKFTNKVINMIYSYFRSF